MGQSFSVVRERPQKKPHVFFRDVDYGHAKDLKEEPKKKTIDVDAGQLHLQGGHLQGHVFTPFSEPYSKTVTVSGSTAGPLATAAAESAFPSALKYSADLYSSEPYALANPGSPRHTIFVDEKDMRKKKNSRGGF